MKNNIEQTITTITKGFACPDYFVSTKPSKYSVIDYITACGSTLSIKKLESEWATVLIPKLKESTIDILRHTGTRLEREWAKSKESRRKQRLERDDDERMRKLLKDTAYVHRAAALEHSERTIRHDFETLEPLLPSSACRTPPYRPGSNSPKQSNSPPAPLTFTPIKEHKGHEDQENEAFFTPGPTLQESLFKTLRKGGSIPSWARDRPTYAFHLQLKEDWGSRVTELYEAAKTKESLDYSNVDEIALLSGIVHINTKHIGFSSRETKDILQQTLENFYSQKMEDNDIQRAQNATELWARWMQLFKSATLKEKLAAKRESRDTVDIDTEPVIQEILQSYSECREQDITPIFHMGLYIFRHFNNWTTMVSESDYMTAVIAPILKEVMSIQHKLKFTCANASTTAGRSRKSALQQDGRSRQPDVIGQTRDNEEIYYGELKGRTTTPEAAAADILRLSIFTKDSLDHLQGTLEVTPPLITFQSVGRNVTFFLGAKINNTVVHGRLSSVALPTNLNELVDLDHEFFFSLLQVESLIRVAGERVGKKRAVPLVPEELLLFPTLGTPERKAAMKSPRVQKTVNP
ncbi:hypothetical protein F5H01DRAFT_98059 [Linnemannia elongata]|nr:hypothetical protein F5H01DRAFT_98059 [Linnemannia elongata]